MTPFQTFTRPGLSDEYKALTQKEFDLRGVARDGVIEPSVLREMWLALAAEYEAEGHRVAAERCRNKAERLVWRQ